MTKIRLQCLVLMLFALSGCALSPSDASLRLNDALHKAVQKDDLVRGASMWVDAPRLNINEGWAHGMARLEDDSAMTVNTPFLSASIGKLFIAATFLSLEKDGKISLEDSVTQWVSADALAGLPKAEHDTFSRMSIRHLLGHRSGLPDYFSGVSKDGAPNVLELMASDPDKSWSREEMLKYTGEHFTAVGEPGAQFHYADTNYDILGLVLEGVEKKPFYQSVRAHVLDPLGLEDTWYHAFESGRAVPYADGWVDDVNLRARPALSADQAGGGLVTTLDDLRRFVRALAQSKPASFDRFSESMSEDAMHDGIDYGLGVFRIRPGGINFLLGQLPEMIGHSGATGAWAYYIAEHDAVLVGSMNQTSWQETHFEFLLSDVVPILSRVSVD